MKFYLSNFSKTSRHILAPLLALGIATGVEVTAVASPTLRTTISATPITPPQRPTIATNTDSLDTISDEIWLLNERDINLLNKADIKVENGKIFLPMSVKDDRTGRMYDLKKHFGKLWDKIERYTARQNQEIDELRYKTRITSSPHFVMGEPPNVLGFIQRLQWSILRADLEASGAHLDILKPTTNDQIGHDPTDDKSLFSIWVRDRWIAGDKTDLFPATPNVPKSRHEAERREAQLLAEWQFAHYGQHRVDGFLEGGDVIQYNQAHTVIVATEAYPQKGFPSPAASVEAAQALAKSLNMDLITVPKILRQSTAEHPPYYHLDTFMYALPDGNMIAIPLATTPEAWQKIRTMVQASGKEVLELPPGTSLLATNLIAVNGNVFSAVYNQQVAAFLRKHGFNYVVGDYQIIDSGPHCLTNVLRRQKPDGRTQISNASSVMKIVPLI